MSDNSPLPLLQICDLAKQWPNLQALHDIAMADLVRMNADAQVELAKRADAKAKADAEEMAKAAAKVKADADMQAAVDAKAEAERKARLAAATGPKVVPATAYAPAEPRRE